MEPKAKPCPFCGSEDTYVFSSDRRTGKSGKVLTGVFWGKCRTCGASSGVALSEEKAIELWNRRATDENEQGVLADGGSGDDGV